MSILNSISINRVVCVFLIVFNNMINSEKMWSPRQQLCFVNMERGKSGLRPLKLHRALIKAATLHSRDMSAHHNMDHKGSDGSSPADRMKRLGIRYMSMGENVARGQRNTRQVMHDWMKSPGHRENIMNREFTHFGGAFISKGNFWTQEFAKFHNDNNDDGIGQLPQNYYSHNNCAQIPELIDTDHINEDNNQQVQDDNMIETSTSTIPNTTPATQASQNTLVLPQSANVSRPVTSQNLPISANVAASVPPQNQPVVSTQIFQPSVPNTIQQLTQIPAQQLTQIPAQQVTQLVQAHPVIQAASQPVIQAAQQPVTQQLVPLNQAPVTYAVQLQ